ncbi:4Fe-4S binding protein [Noviherbaspirillum autotrophicum]|uniref:Regulatory protein n=1 Tax=Noviherbaspirillum autotrophicum TaxID=709839 RepID=A0A0C2BP93_9BURK|nr:4Fe-4S binding protein [Noviherbaspirillum autotrophicum]KIF83105.1 regulatory protein [Noviherbaspirillum autotrophicum]
MKRRGCFIHVLRMLLAGVLLGALACAASWAGVMTRDVLEKKFPSPLMIAQKDDALPVWPVFRQNGTVTELVGYLFESIDFAAIPGFSGVPLNLLVALDAGGRFIDVQVISQHEPVFLDGLGEAPLHKFVSQYRGLSLKQNIAIDTARRDRAAQDGGNVHIDGVTKATASVRIINQSVLSAALKVARKKLGFSGLRDPDQIARVRQDVHETLDAKALAAEGLFKPLVLRNADVEKAFAGTAGAGLDEQAAAHPGELFADMRFAYVSVPSVGRSLLDDASWARLSERLEPGDHALLVQWRGRYGPVSDDFVAGAVPDRLILAQGGLPIEMRDMDLDLSLRRKEGAPASMKVFRVISQAGLDPAQPLDFSLRVTRLKGMIYPERIGQDFVLSYRLPQRFYSVPEGDSKSWLPLWKQRWIDIALLAVALAVLFIALSRQAVLSANARRLALFRNFYLAFTLLFIGWHAQGQLSIVNVTGVLQAMKEGRGLGFLLYDPISVVLWGAVLVSLVIWGRGTFCGWLCPFGALQEFSAKLGKWLHLPQLRLHTAADAKLKLLKYVVLAGVVGSVFVAPAATDRLVEFEPFKTAITLLFVRSWPFVLYAAGLLLASAFCYKFFCRYLCPFGAGLALLGRVRLLSWLARRPQCGKPCQTCRHRCAYQAIRPDGTIRYDECFQCMDCVAIYHDDDKCAPLMLEKKRGAVIPIRQV